MKQVKTILWDLDGTLIDSFEIFGEVLGSVIPAYGFELPPHEIMVNNYHGSLEDTINNVLGGDLESGMHQAIVHDFLEAQNSHYEMVNHHIFPDALSLARRARAEGLYQVIVTNRSHVGRLNASPRSIVERSDLKDVIDMVVAGDDSEHRKPKPAVIEVLLRSGRVVPETTLVVGDQHVDADFARNLGSKAVLVSRDGKDIPHMEQLGNKWSDFVTITPSLETVSI